MCVLNWNSSAIPEQTSFLTIFVLPHFTFLFRLTPFTWWPMLSQWVEICARAWGRKRTGFATGQPEWSLHVPEVMRQQRPLLSSTPWRQEAGKNELWILITGALCVGAALVQGGHGDTETWTVSPLCDFGRLLPLCVSGSCLWSEVGLVSCYSHFQVKHCGTLSRVGWVPDSRGCWHHGCLGLRQQWSQCQEEQGSKGMFQIQFQSGLLWELGGEWGAGWGRHKQRGGDCGLRPRGQAEEMESAAWYPGRGGGKGGAPLGRDLAGLHRPTRSSLSSYNQVGSEE